MSSSNSSLVLSSVKALQRVALGLQRAGQVAELGLEPRPGHLQPAPSSLPLLGWGESPGPPPLGSLGHQLHESCWDPPHAHARLLPPQPLVCADCLRWSWVTQGTGKQGSCPPITGFWENL